MNTFRLSHFSRGILLIAAGMALLTSEAWGQNAELVAKGKRLAEANCAVCHAIGETGTSKLAAAIPFRDMALDFDQSDLEDALNEGVPTEHPAMPDWQMTPDQASALAAYIMSLAPAGTKKTELETPLQGGVANP